MWGRLYWEPALGSTYAAAAAMVLLATVLAAYGFNHKATRLFIVFLVLRALASVSALMRESHLYLTEDLGNAAFWAAVFPYFMIPIPFLMLGFALVYPHPRRILAGRVPPTWFWWAVGFAALGTVVAFEILHAADHGYWKVEGVAAIQNGWERDGAHTFLLGAANLSYGLLAWVFARDASRNHDTDLGTSLLLVSTGFVVNAAYGGLGVLYFLWSRGVTPTVTDTLTSLATIPAAFATAILVRNALAHRRSGWGRLAERAVWIIAGSLVFQVALIIDALYPGWRTPQTLITVPNGLIRLSIPLLVTYALLRHQLFDIDLKVKWTLAKGTVAAVIYGVFFVISEGIEQALDVNGLWFGIAAAGLVALALRPVHRGAQALADAMMPGVRGDDAALTAQKLDVYATTYESIVWDGTMTAKEAQSLASLRDKLGLSSAACLARETQVRARLGLSAEPVRPSGHTL